MTAPTSVYKQAMSLQVEQGIAFEKAYQAPDGKMHVVAAVSNNETDLQRDRMSEVALTKMAEKAKRGIPLLDNHKASVEFGMSTDGQIVQRPGKNGKEVQSLLLDFELDGDFPEARKIFREVAAKKCDRQLSVGATLDLTRPGVVRVDLERDGMVRTINDLDLDHVAVTRPGKAANPGTGFVSAVMKALDTAVEKGEVAPLIVQAPTTQAVEKSEPAAEPDGKKIAAKLLDFLSGHFGSGGQGMKSDEVKKQMAGVTVQKGSSNSSDSSSLDSSDSKSKSKTSTSSTSSTTPTSSSTTAPKSESTWQTDSEYVPSSESSSSGSMSTGKAGGMPPSDDMLVPPPPPPPAEEPDEADADMAGDVPTPPPMVGDAAPADGPAQEAPVDEAPAEEGQVDEDDEETLEDEGAAAPKLGQPAMKSKETVADVLRDIIDLLAVREEKGVTVKNMDQAKAIAMKDSTVLDGLKAVRYVMADVLKEVDERAAQITDTNLVFAPRSGAKGARPPEKATGDVDIARQSVTDYRKVKPTGGEVKSTAPSAPDSLKQVDAALRAAGQLPTDQARATYGKSTDLDKAAVGELTKALKDGFAGVESVLVSIQQQQEAVVQKVNEMDGRISGLETVAGPRQSGPSIPAGGEGEQSQVFNWGGIFSGGLKRATSRNPG